MIADERPPGARDEAEVEMMLFQLRALGVPLANVTAVVQIVTTAYQAYLIELALNKAVRDEWTKILGPTDQAN